ncbi:conserved hypothetical protein [Sulfurovum sp. enrichment culture clone C5]|uniref:RiboL-PSP-HEPN domain-containing protein n=1 Tax=Sulfurovum sp. enrichment culture clone C5 TaxID=497650 RepID=A0A0S4XP11_9BACT|nr:conserved hypothetical protein [Sulfurovum sp. enrichment culture clone C5]
MISNTNSFKTLKEQVQEVINFSVLCCSAVPSLKGYMKAIEKGSAAKLPDADYYHGDPDFQRLRDYIPAYKKNLGKLMLLSSFSYFEAYFKSMITEFFNYHGGFDTYIEMALSRQKSHILYAENEPAKTSVRKLREYPKNGKKDKYIKHAKLLANSEFRFPSELMSAFGAKELHARYKDMKSVDIPHFAQWCFGVPLSEYEIKTFHSVRETRNDIAHGKKQYVDIGDAMEYNKTLRALALKIDSHIVEHFFVIEAGSEKPIEV